MLVCNVINYISTAIGFVFLIFIAVWLLLSTLFNGYQTSVASLQIGLLDPIPLVYRSINLVILPLVDRTSVSISTIPRAYDGTCLIATIFLSAVLLNLAVPRFYCRFICPAGAMFGILSRFAVWRIGKYLVDGQVDPTPVPWHEDSFADQTLGVWNDLDDVPIGEVVVDSPLITPSDEEADVVM